MNFIPTFVLSLTEERVGKYTHTYYKEVMLKNKNIERTITFPWETILFLYSQINIANLISGRSKSRKLISHSTIPPMPKIPRFNSANPIFKKQAKKIIRSSLQKRVKIGQVFPVKSKEDKTNRHFKKGRQLALGTELCQ